MVSNGNELRTNRFTVRLNDTELNELKVACAIEGMKQSDLVRFAIRELIRLRNVDIATWAEILAPIGVEDGQPS